MDKREPKATEQFEPRPDGWERFEKAVDAALHTAPKHRATKPDAQQQKPTKRARGGA
jgi:hypothetical protein